jgi:hypothetical protein
MTVLYKVKAIDLVDYYWFPTFLRMEHPHIDPTVALILIQRTEVAIKLRILSQAALDSPNWNFLYTLIDSAWIKKPTVNCRKREQPSVPICQLSQNAFHLCPSPCILKPVDRYNSLVA